MSTHRICGQGHSWDASKKHQCGDCKAAYERRRPKRNRAVSQRSTSPDRARAWRAVEYAKKRGRLPNAKSLVCTDCGRQAREYDHHQGYAPEQRLNVVPVCRPCHVQRTWGKRLV